MFSSHQLLSFRNLSDEQVADVLHTYHLSLTVDDARHIEENILHRPFTLAEAVAWSIQSSEHCSYKSSRRFLKMLPTSAPNVILGPGEDAGIVELARSGNRIMCIVMGHESHNHPSQVVPYEGAATGIGGIVRDVVCMGAKVIALADPLRFGDPENHQSRLIEQGVVAGIAGYGNPIGIPTIAGDVYFDQSFEKNCLVNVVSLGLVEAAGIIHSRVPEMARNEPYDFILVGKATDNSGFGGASFASGSLDDQARRKHKGAVQEPNAFLKRHLLDATYELFEVLQKRGLVHTVGLKDLGAGGILGASLEMAVASGFGVEIDIGLVPVSLPDLLPHVVLASETQERLLWVAPRTLSPLILDHYNRRWNLPSVSAGARAAVIGYVTAKENYVSRVEGFGSVIDVPARSLVEGFPLDRAYKRPMIQKFSGTYLEPRDYGYVLNSILQDKNVCSRKPIFDRYDKSVQGVTIIEPGEADAGVIAPLIDESDPQLKYAGAALSVDSNPFLCSIDPYWGAVSSVVEAMRNVAAVGAYPWAITDCLNFGDPEKEDQMGVFTESVRGISDACRSVHLKEYPEAVVPVVSGNVSFYNTSVNGSIAPSPIVACLGKLPDYRFAVTMEFKEAKSELFLIGARQPALGGSVFSRLLSASFLEIPRPRLSEVEREIFALTEAIQGGLILSCHDISEGGLAVTVAEMAFGGDGENRIGCSLDLSAFYDLSLSATLFSESGGFVLETKQVQKVQSLFRSYQAPLYYLGETVAQPEYRVVFRGSVVMRTPLSVLARLWLNGLKKYV